MNRDSEDRVAETSGVVRRSALRPFWQLAAPFMLVGAVATFHEMMVIRHLRWCNPIDRDILVSCEPIWPISIWFAGYIALAWLLGGVFASVCLKQGRRAKVFLIAAAALVVFYISGAVFFVFEPIAKILT